MRIEHIDEVLPHVEGRPEFVVARREGYVAVDYLFQTPDTFTHPVRRECRGIKFCAHTGKILARPFGKFFNIGEREETQPQAIDFTRPHWVLSKMDGSMIHPMLLDGNVVLCTRMGRTQHGIMAERHLTPELSGWFRQALEEGWTPICEWVAPDNRIVIKYPESKLVLLAIRNTVTGEYQEPAAVRVNGIRAGLDVVETHPSWGGTAHDFLDMVRVLLDAEGFVIRFEHGDWYKCKAEDYLIKTRAKGAVELEKNALAVIMAGGLDDVKPLLEPKQVEAVETYEKAVQDGIFETASKVVNLVDSGAHMDQKAFATEHLRDAPVMLRALAFQVRKGAGALDAVKALISKNLGSQNDVDKVRHLFGNAAWPL